MVQGVAKLTTRVGVGVGGVGGWEEWGGRGALRSLPQGPGMGEIRQPGPHKDPPDLPPTFDNSQPLFEGATLKKN